jgi:hypothetical protein
MTLDDIESILNTSTKANEINKITGFLIYRNKQFRQLIEGHPDKIERLFLNIVRDKRHNVIEKNLDHIVEERTFPLWAIGFSVCDYTNMEAKTVDEFISKHINVFETSLIEDVVQNDIALDLLKSFISN